MPYDPLHPPDPSQWLALSEGDRLNGVLEFHGPAGAALPNARLHAALHVTVENQVAEGYRAVVEALARLTGEGLDRHESVHAVGAAVAERMRQVLQSGKPAFDKVAYETELAALTAADWKAGAG